MNVKREKKGKGHVIGGGGGGGGSNTISFTQIQNTQYYESYFRYSIASSSLYQFTISFLPFFYYYFRV